MLVSFWSNEICQGSYQLTKIKYSSCKLYQMNRLTVNELQTILIFFKNISFCFFFTQFVSILFLSQRNTKGRSGNSYECLANHKVIYISEIYVSTNFKFQNCFVSNKKFLVNLQNKLQNMNFFKKNKTAFKSLFCFSRAPTILNNILYPGSQHC